MNNMPRLTFGEVSTLSRWPDGFDPRTRYQTRKHMFSFFRKKTLEEEIDIVKGIVLKKRITHRSANTATQR